MSDLNENTAKRYPLNISEKQVSKPREHTGGKIDIKTGKPMMMRKIYIPSQEYRPKDVDLGVDANGIDRNERKGYINVPDRHIFVDKKREGRLYTYPVCRKTPCFSYGDIRHFHRIYASN